MAIRNSKSLKKWALTSAALSVIAHGVAFAQDKKTVEFDIDAQELGDALNEFGLQSGKEVFFLETDIDGKHTDGLEGTYSPGDAINLLLDDTGIQYRDNGNGTILIGEAYIRQASLEQESRPFRVAQANTQDDRVVETNSRDNDVEEEKQRDTIIVTGTNIRGISPDSSPVDVYTELDIAKTGSVTLEQFISKLPQNLNSITSTARLAGPENGSGRNGVDLRGLGSGTTLVLLNGKRLVAPGGDSPDISLIPLSAIERVEVLPDGASAIYGSDAIGGVVNIILKDDMDGFNAGLTYGTVTNGNHDQFKADITAGKSWNTGNITASYSFFDQTPLLAEDRDFSSAARPYFLLPDDVRHSVLGAVEQRLGDKLTFNADALYSTRKTQNILARQVFDGVDTLDDESEQIFLNGGLAYEIDDNFTFDLFVTYSDFTEDQDFTRIQNSDGSIDFTFTDHIAGDELEVGAKVDGAIFRLPAGELRIAMGGGYSEETYDRELTSINLARDRYYAFGEAFIPIIAPQQNIPGINQLEVTGALRYTDYSDFGSDLSPRVGVLWSPIDGVKFRGTYSEAFRAPSLNQLGLLNQYFLFRPADFFLPDLFSDDNSSVYLFTNQGDFPGLGPETSVSYTAGFDIDRTGIEGLSLSGTYFSIDYVDRLGSPDSTGGFALFLDPDAFPSVINTNPSAEFIAGLTDNAMGRVIINTTGVDASDLDAIIAITTVTFDNRIQNIASSKVSGFDFGFDYSRDTSAGEFSFGGQMTFMFESEITPSAAAPVISELNRPAQPVDFKLRSYAGFARGGFAGQVSLNYVDSYSDPFQTPEVNIENWTTVDLNIRYAFSDTGNIGILENTVLSLNVQNLFNQDPPFVGLSGTTNIALNEPVGFDPVNASPLGRFITFGLRKRF